MPKRLPPLPPELENVTLVDLADRIRRRDGAFYVAGRYVSPAGDPTLPDAARHLHASRLIARAAMGNPDATREISELMVAA